MESTILHIALPEDWQQAEAVGVYEMSTRGTSLAQQGYIHCSFEHQVERTANTYYRDLDRLVLLEIDPAALGPALVVEAPFPGASEDFPHVYGPIPVDAVVEITDWRRIGDAWTLP